MATLFVTGGTGFIGRAFVRRAAGAGHRVVVLTRSDSAAKLISAHGVDVVVGDLSTGGPWQRAVADADAVVHLAQPETYGGQVTRARAAAYREKRVRMDANLLAALDPRRVDRVVYVAGTSYYGDVGRWPVDEDVAPRPRGWGPYVAPAIEALPAHVARGLPVIEAFPGWVYGAGSWFVDYVLKPLRRRQLLYAIWGRTPIVSPIHVEDCARAILHLLEHGVVGRRYFVVDDRPIQSSALAERAARALDVPFNVFKVPGLVVRMTVGPIIAESLKCNANLSNARLRALGFQCKFPTIDEGVPDVVREWLAKRATPRA